MRRTAALIAGGGPAGSAAAIGLARAGARPLLIERHAETADALCGGFLSWHTLRAIERLGVDRHALGGHAVSRVRIFAGRRQAEAALPESAMGVSRRRLDSVLLDAAAAAGAEIERGVAIREAEQGIVRLADGGEIAADAIFLATGKHELRGLARPRDAAGPDPALGLRVRVTPGAGLSRVLEGVIELHLFDRGYAGVVLQEDGGANVCMAVRKSRLGEAGGSPAALLAALCGENAALAERLDGCPRDAIDAIAAIPYGWRAHQTGPGLFRLGDQAAVIPSLAGEGVGIAIASGIAAARAWERGGRNAAPAFQRGFAIATRRPVLVADLLRRVAERPRGAAAAAMAVARAPTVARLLARATRIGIEV